MARTILAEHRTCSIRDAKEGAITKICGRVVLSDGGLLRSPLSSRACVYFDVDVAAGTKTLIRDREACDFLVEDATGRALIRTDDLLVVIKRDHEIHARPADAPEVARLLAMHRYSGPRARLLVREGVIEEGEEVAVVGHATWVLDELGGGTYRERRRLLVMTPPESQPLIVSDDLEAYRD